MTTRNSRVEKVTLAAAVVQSEEGYLATLDELALTGAGPTIREAQDDLVGRFVSWVQACDGQETLAEQLLGKGYPGVGDDTELELEFVE